MKTLSTLLICFSFISISFTQVTNTFYSDTCYKTVIPSIIVKCIFDKDQGWHQEASLETEQLINECPIDSIYLLAFDTTNNRLDTIFDLNSNRIQKNLDKNNCWQPEFLPAQISFYYNNTLVATDTFPIQVSILENSKKCACGTGKGQNNMSGSIGFGKISLEFDEKRNKATKLGLSKKQYTTEFIEYNYSEGRIVKVDNLSKIKGKIYIDESHLSTGFSRNNNFPEAEYKIIKQEKDLIVIMAESRREDGDLMIWKVVIKSEKIDVTGSWYRGGEIKTTYIVNTK